MIKAAMQLADARGMTLVSSPTDPGLGRIRCRACGWPNTPPDVYDIQLEQYCLAPHGCHPCTWEETHGRPMPVIYNGHPRPRG